MHSLFVCLLGMGGFMKWKQLVGCCILYVYMFVSVFLTGEGCGIRAGPIPWARSGSWTVLQCAEACQTPTQVGILLRLIYMFPSGRHSFKDYIHVFHQVGILLRLILYTCFHQVGILLRLIYISERLWRDKHIPIVVPQYIVFPFKAGKPTNTWQNIPKYVG